MNNLNRNINHLTKLYFNNTARKYTKIVSFFFFCQSFQVYCENWACFSSLKFKLVIKDQNKGKTQAKQEKDTPATQHRTLQSIYKRLFPKVCVSKHTHTCTHTQSRAVCPCSRPSHFPTINSKIKKTEINRNLTEVGPKTMGRIQSEAGVSNVKNLPL